MNTYYTKIAVVPLPTNPQYNEAGEATAFCWVKAKNQMDSITKSVFLIQKDEWEIVNLDQPPVEVQRNDFEGRDIGLRHFDKAQQYGYALLYVGIARDGQNQKGPVELRSRRPVDIRSFLRESAKVRTRGRCLHYDAGKNCSDFSQAHSIQRKGMLSIIATDGHVYALDRDFFTVRKNAGRLSYKKQGIKNVSTFYGLCNKHDNEVFRPIDNSTLVPTREQVALYSYRAICREVFLKTNSLELIDSQLHHDQVEAVRTFFSSLRIGTENGLRNLLRHKRWYDRILRSGQFDSVRYLMFTSSQQPNIAFSGISFPDYDFTGAELQDLSDLQIDLSMITFCSAPTKDGWAFLLGWYEDGSPICANFAHSLKAAAKAGPGFEPFLFLLALSCENHAVSPEWWESLPQTVRDLIIERLSDAADVMAETQNTYLKEGLAGYSPWAFNSLVDDSGKRVDL